MARNVVATVWYGMVWYVMVWLAKNGVMTGLISMFPERSDQMLRLVEVSRKYMHERKVPNGMKP